MNLDTRIDPASTASTRTDGYWQDPRQQTDAIDSQADLDRNPVSPAGIEAQEPRPFGLMAQPDPAVPVDGSSSNPSQRTSGRTPDGKQIQIDPLHTGEQATISRERTIAQAGFGQTYVSSDQLVFSTNGAGNDQVKVNQRSDGTVEVSVNGETYEVDLAERQELTLRVGAGDDLVEVAPNVRVNIVVDGGAGDDSITTGAGDDRIDGGAGNDTISSGDGRDDVFGNTGNDTVEAGAGDDVVHGGDGNDTLTAGNGTNFIEAGAGDDIVAASQGTNMVSGGTGNDRVTSGGDNSIYLGSGTDSVEGATSGDKVYAESVDAVRFAAGQRDTGQVVVNVAIDASLGTRGVSVEGSSSFRQRVEAEIEFLRSSPNGQQMLAQFDQAAARGNTVTIRELANEQNGYAQTLGRGNAEISNGRAGTGSDVVISYNPSFHMDAFPAPQVVLYHEMSHAYNGVTGTFQPGTYRGTGPDSGNVPNAERQAVGLETSAPAFDFDGNPATPPTTSNPIALTENGLRRELGLPDRPAYTL